MSGSIDEWVDSSQSGEREVDFSDPIFKGATRPAMIWGVPVIPFMAGVAVVLLIANQWTLYAVVLLWPVIAFMRGITATDPQQFRLIGLFIYFRIIHLDVNFRHWKMSTFTANSDWK